MDRETEGAPGSVCNLGLGFAFFLVGLGYAGFVMPVRLKRYYGKGEEARCAVAQPRLTASGARAYEKPQA
jgi:hypothetical protein